MVKAIVGANWGDEGKGKITDMLAEQSDVVIRFQGGANAGHTIINDYGRFALHILPSGTFYPHITNIIGNGVALDVRKLVAELKSITDQGVPAPNLIVSERAQILMPYHRLQDSYEEERLGGKAFGSVSSKEIAEEAKSQLGLDIDKKKIQLKETIKTLGTHNVPVKLHPKVTVELKVVVTEEA